MSKHRSDMFGSEVDGRFFRKLWWWLQGYRPTTVTNRARELNPHRTLRLSSYWSEQWERSPD